MAEWISVREAAELAGCLRQNIAYHIRKKNIIARKSGRIWLVDKGSLLGHLRSKSAGTQKGRDGCRTKGDSRLDGSEIEDQHKEILQLTYSWVNSPSDRARLIAIDEDQDRLPYGELSREKSRLIQRSLDNLGILYYNLDISDAEQIDHFLEPDYQQCHRAVIWDDISEGTKEVYRNLIRGDQPEYRVIVDKIMRGDKLSKEELDHIQAWAFGYLDQMSLPDGRWIIFPQYGIYRLHRIYGWVIDLTLRKEIPLKRCALDECDHIFIPGSGRYQKKYCSNAHRVKAFRQRKAMAASQGPLCN